MTTLHHQSFLDRLDLRYTFPRIYTNLQSLVKCLDHRGIASDTECSHHQSLDTPLAQLAKDTSVKLQRDCHKTATLLQSDAHAAMQIAQS